MSDHDLTNVQTPVIKAVAAWSGVGIAELLQSVGINTWGEAAAAAATLYTVFLIIEWVIKKIYALYLWRKSSKP